MATETSSIDDLLSGVSSTTKQEIEENNHEIDTQESYYESESNESETHDSDYENDSNDEEDLQNEDNSEERNIDEYGNEKPAPRTYTEDEVNERINKAIRERLARGNHQANQQPTQQQIENQSKDFEYDPNGEGNWQQQLEQFVEQTFAKMTQKQIQQQQQIREQQAESEFIDKFNQGMERFNDFRDVVGSQPITDPMTLALRGFKDPAAFIYAASKRHPTELQRISNIKDPYSQIVEMGKLEERMRKTPQSTKAPRPITRNSDDAPINHKKKSNSEPTIEDLIAQAENKKLSKLKQFRGK